MRQPRSGIGEIQITAGLISSAVDIPLSMAFGMFALVSLGDKYFAYGAMAGLVSAIIAGLVCVLVIARTSTRRASPRRFSWASCCCTPPTQPPGPWPVRPESGLEAGLAKSASETPAECAPRLAVL